MRSPASPHALENVRSTATFGRSPYSSSRRARSVAEVLPVRLVEHDQQSAGTASRKASSSAAATAVPVGLFGLQTKISRVRSVTAAAIASGRGLPGGAAPARWWRAVAAMIGYASKERHA